METGEMIKILQDCKSKEKLKCEEIKHSINSDYFLAKLDFLVIENYEDSINTLDDCIDKLNSLQERIIERNRR